jgi:hypothetical protein
MTFPSLKSAEEVEGITMVAVAAGEVWAVVVGAAADTGVVEGAAADTGVVEGAAASTRIVVGAAANTGIVAGTAANTGMAAGTAAGTGIDDMATGTIVVAIGTRSHGGLVSRRLLRHITIDRVMGETIMFSGVLIGTGPTILGLIHLEVMTATIISAEAPIANMQTV